MVHQVDDYRVEFETVGETLRVTDALEGEEVPLRLDREPDPQPALPDLFPVPVDRAVSFEVESIAISDYSTVSVREAGGDFIAQLDEPMELPLGSYCFDVTGVTKVLVRAVDVAVSTTGMAGPDPVRLAFDRPTTVTVGARSLHTRPEATITVPDDPAALAEAVSVLGSSIAEFSPERSWPTLRGYPPRIERGDELDIPSPLIEPDTGIEVVVRPTYADVYRLSTLAYYLGASVVVGDEPAIRFDTGYVERLPTDGVALENRVAELLRTWFFLDTLARTEGYVPSDRYEYEQVGPELHFYPPKLADLSMSERLMEYLEVDPDTVAPYAPEWPTEAVLRPGPEAAELLPHLAHVLAPARVRGEPEPTVPDAPAALATSPWLTTGEEAPNPDASPIPPGTSVLTPKAYENWIERTSIGRDGVRVVVIVDSVDRAAAIRRSLSQPAVPESVGAWEVHGRPDAETVSSVLSDPDIDVAYCGLPIENGRVVAADGVVSVGDLDAAPSLAVFEGTDDVAVGVSTVTNGGLASVVAEQAIAPSRIRSLVGLLAIGTPVGLSVGLASGETNNVRLAGDQSVFIGSNPKLDKWILSVNSRSEQEFTARAISTLSIEYQIGAETKLLLEPFETRNELAGKELAHDQPISVSEILHLTDADETILVIDGAVVLNSDDRTETDLRELSANGSRGESRAEMTE